MMFGGWRSFDPALLCFLTLPWFVDCHREFRLLRRITFHWTLNFIQEASLS